MRNTDNLTPEAVRALSDAALTQLLAERVMGWKEVTVDGGDYWMAPDDPLCIVFEPLTDANDTLRVVEKCRTLWAEAEDGTDKHWIINDLNGDWKVGVFDKNLGFSILLFSVHRASYCRAVCEAAALAFGAGGKKKMIPVIHELDCECNLCEAWNASSDEG